MSVIEPDNVTVGEGTHFLACHEAVGIGFRYAKKKKRRSALPGLWSARANRRHCTVWESGMVLRVQIKARMGGDMRMNDLEGKMGEMGTHAFDDADFASRPWTFLR